MNITSSVKETSTVEKQIEVKIEREEFNNIFEEKLKEYSKKLHLKGFRKGKIPKKVVIQRFGDSIKAESLENLIQNSISFVCKKENIEAIGIRNLENLKNEDEQPIYFSFIADTDSEVKIANYKDLKVKAKAPEKITPETIEKELKHYQKNLAEQKDYSGKGKEGIIAIGKYTKILLDGEEQKINNPDFQMEIGSQNIKEFNKALNNCSVGDNIKVSVKYDKKYEVESLQGKKTKYFLHIDALKELTLPEINNELAKKLGSESLDNLKELIKKNLTDSAEKKVKDDAYKKVIDTIIKNIPFDVAQTRINHYLEVTLQSYKNSKEKIDLSKIPKKQLKSLEEKALYTLKEHKILESIAQEENIKPSQEKVDEYIANMTTQYQMKPEDLKESLRKNGQLVEIREQLKKQLVLDFLIEN